MTNLEKLIKLYTEYPPDHYIGTNDYGEYGNNFRMTHTYKKLREKDDKLLNELVEFKINTNSGVYMIEDFYIGESEYNQSSKAIEFKYDTNGIRNRIAGHLHEMFYYHWNKHFNEKYEGEFDDVRYNYLKTNKMWQTFIENDRLTVKQLSDKPEDENDLINFHLDEGYDLQNPYQIIERKLLPEMETKCLAEQKNWHIDNVWFNHRIYTKLQDTNKYNKFSLYDKYKDGIIDMKMLLEEADSINVKEGIIRYKIYDEEFTEFDKNFRLRYEQISDEQINKYR